MEAFLEDLERQPVGETPLVPAQEGRPQGSPLRTSPQKYSDFRKILERVAKPLDLRCFVLKSIIINNLYGVDIMDVAIEICKLRALSEARGRAWGCAHGEEAGCRAGDRADHQPS